MLGAVIALCVGALATWAAAWGFALWEQRQDGVCANPDRLGAWSGPPRMQRSPNGYAMFLGAISGGTIAKEERSKAGVRCTTFLSGGLRPAEDRIWRFGWPAPCLGWHESAPAAYLRGTYRPKRPSAWANGWEIEMGRLGRWVVPLRASWGAAALDMAAWSAAVAMLLFGVPAARRWRRTRRGRCAACGYDRAGLGVDAPCPECGAATSPR